MLQRAGELKFQCKCSYLEIYQVVTQELLWTLLFLTSSRSKLPTS